MNTDKLDRIAAQALSMAEERAHVLAMPEFYADGFAAQWGTWCEDSICYAAARLIAILETGTDPADSLHPRY